MYIVETSVWCECVHLEDVITKLHCIVIPHTLVRGFSKSLSLKYETSAITSANQLNVQTQFTLLCRSSRSNLAFYHFILL